MTNGERFEAKRFPTGWRVVDTHTGHVHSAVIWDPVRAASQAVTMNATMDRIARNNTRYDINVTDGTRVERFTGVDYTTRNRLVDYGFRHNLRVIVRDADPRPTRRSYR